jgi:sugar fermentation stimulation protein A
MNLPRKILCRLPARNFDIALKTLIDVKKQGMRAVMLYVVQRGDVEIFAPAREIDPDYSNMLKKAVEAGVEVIPMQAKVSPEKN